MIGSAILLVSIILTTWKISSVSIFTYAFYIRRDFCYSTYAFCLCRDLHYFPFLDPRPDCGLRPAFFDVFTAPPTNASQRRNQFGWQNQWKLNWRRLCRRGRYNSAQRKYMDDEMLGCPVDVEYYLRAPAVWCEMPTGMLNFLFMSRLFVVEIMVSFILTLRLCRTRFRVCRTVIVAISDFYNCSGNYG